MNGARPRDGGEEHVAGLRRDEHERAALRLHVVADEREQAVDELPRVVRPSRRA